MNSYEETECKFYQDSKHIDFSTFLVGSKGNKLIRFILRYLDFNKIHLNILNKETYLRVLLGNLIKINLFNNRDYARTPMNSNDFIKIREESYFSIGFSGWKTLIFVLENCQLIKRKRGIYFPNSNQSYQTVIRFTNKFLRKINKYNFDIQDIKLFKKGSGIKINNEEIKENNLSKRLFEKYKQLNKYNELIKSSKVSIDYNLIEKNIRQRINFENTTYKRYFTKNLLNNGRYYGPWWQNINCDYRKLITIDDQNTIELDYNSMHMHIIYSLENINANDLFNYSDLYEVKDVPRQITKIVFTVLLNCPHSNKSQINKILGKKIYDSFPDLFEKNYNYKNVYDLLKMKHPSICKYFFANLGSKIFNIESKITSYVINKLTRKKILTLSIHDSFLVKENNEIDLRNIMIDAFKYYNYKSIPKINKK